MASYLRRPTKESRKIRKRKQIKKEKELRDLRAARRKLSKNTIMGQAFVKAYISWRENNSGKEYYLK